MIKSILFKGTLKGNGIVNFDSVAQKWVLRERFPSESNALRFDNVKIAKHSFYKVGQTEEGKPIWERRLCISADCLRNAIFSADFPFQNTAILHHEEMLTSVLASPAALLRGYMFAADGKTAIKRKSPLMITAAEQTSNGTTHFEVGSMSGAKRTKEDDDDAGDTSFHYEEKAGHVDYAFEGALDLTELQFVSFSPFYDRLAMLPDHKEAYRAKLSTTLGSKVDDVRFLVKKGALIRTPEEGILISPNQVATIVGEFFSRLLSLGIRKSKGYAHIDSLQVKFVRNPIDDTLHDSGGWRPVSKPSDAVPPPKEIHVSYEEVPEEEALDTRNRIETNQSATAEVKKAKAKVKKENAAAKKAARTVVKAS
jgi:hypothetical protein